MLNDFLHFNPQVIALSIMIICYSIIFTEKINRAIVALFGAAAMVLFGILSQHEAIASIDFNTVNLLIGMMLSVGILEKTGVFQYIAMYLTKKVRANPRAFLAVLGALTAMLSGYIDNVTTVLLLTPVVIQVTRTLEVTCFPYLMMMIFACNIGGAATLIGDPPNIMVGSYLELTFFNFFKHMTPISYILTGVLIAGLDFVWGRKIYSPPAKRALITTIDEREYLTDVPFLKKALFIMALIITGFILAHRMKLETGTVSIIGALVMMLTYTWGDKHGDAEEKIREAFKSVDWITIFFFAGLFIVVSGLRTTGILEIAGHKFVEFTDGNFDELLYGFLWIATGISGVVDNIPFVATMMPILETIEANIPGGREEAMPLWWALLMGACYGGNATVIASSANVVVVGIASQQRRTITFLRFMLYGIPVTIISAAISSLYLYLIYG